MRLADYVAEFLVKQGVRHVFLLTGGGAMYLNNALGRRKDLECVCVLHEQAAAIAADAYSKIAGGLGVVNVTAGPGGTNAITGVVASYLDSIPVLVLSGQVKRADLKTGTGLRQLGVQEVDIVSMVQSVTKYAVTVTEPKDIRYHLEKAVHLATSGRPGPVWLDLPLDVQAAPIEPDQLRPYIPDTSAESFDVAKMNDQVDATIDLLRNAQRPVLMVGHGVRVAGATRELDAVIEKLGAPVLVATSMGVDLVADDHPLYFGRPGPIAPRYANFTLQNCDCLIVVGARLDMAMTGYAHDRLARGAKKVQVDIDPAELAKMRTPIHQSIHADAKVFLQTLLSRLGAGLNKDWSAWIQRCRDWKQRYPVVLQEYRDQTDRVSTYYFSEVLSEELAPDDILATCSSGNAIELFHLVFKAKQGQRAIHSRSLGPMGFGIPAAIGACLAAGKKRTVCFDGDGGFQLNIQELETARRLNLPIKFFVINNDCYASIRLSQKNHFNGELIGADGSSGVTLPPLDKIALAYGATPIRIDSQVNLRQQVRQALDTPGVVVVDVVVPGEEVRQPRMASATRANGTIYSKPLEDLWPFLDRDEFRANMIVPPLEE